MSAKTKFILGAIGLAGALGATQAHAQSATAAQVESLQKQISALEKKLNSVQQKTFLNASAGYMPTKAKFAPPVCMLRTEMTFGQVFGVGGLGMSFRGA